MANKALRVVAVGSLVAGLLTFACGDGDDGGDGGGKTGGESGTATGGTSGGAGKGGSAGTSAAGGRGGTSGSGQGGSGDTGGDAGSSTGGDGGSATGGDGGMGVGGMAAGMGGRGGMTSGGMGGMSAGIGGMGGMGGRGGMTGGGMGGMSAGMGGMAAGMGGMGAGGMAAGMGGMGAGGMAAGMGGMGAGGMAAGMGGMGAGGMAAGMGGMGAGGMAAGMGGMGAGGMAAGMGGMGGMPSTTATGVERISIPLTAADQGQRYNVQNTVGSSTYDLAGTTLTIRAYAPGATGGDLSVFFRSAGGADTTPIKVALSTITGGFTNVPITVPAASGSYNPVMTEIIRIEVEAGGGTFGSAWLNPTLVIIDSIVSSNAVVNVPFDAAPAGNVFSSSGARNGPTGTANTWTATYP